MGKGLVKLYVEIIKEDYSDLLGKIGYNNIEEDLTDDGEWHGDIKPLGKVAFWRGESKDDGIVIRHVKFYGPDGQTAHGRGFYAIGNAPQQLKKLGYKCRGYETKIKINNREYKAIKLFGDMNLYDFLEEKTKSYRS